MLNDRDSTVMVVARDCNLHTLRVSDIMSNAPITAHQDDAVNNVYPKCAFRIFERISFMANEGVLIGIVPLNGLLEVVADE